MNVTAKERAELAKQAGISEQYLYQCLSGRRDMDPDEAVRVEAATARRLRRWHLRRGWHRTWPELVGVEGAPAVPAEEASDAA